MLIYFCLLYFKRVSVNPIRVNAFAYLRNVYTKYSGRLYNFGGLLRTQKWSVLKREKEKKQVEKKKQRIK